MNLISKKNIKALLKKYQIHPSEQLGQNFLIDKNVVKKIIKAAELRPKDIVLEIGPGIGVLTQKLANPRGQPLGLTPGVEVVAVEKDPKMVEILKETLKDFKNIEIINKDILKISNFEFLIPNYKVVANLPFYITALIIRKFLESKHPPKEMVLIVQKEVAQRICSKPPKMNILAVSVQFYAKPKIISYISKKSFWPSPKVNSAIIKIVPQKKYKDVNIDLFFKIVKTGFSHPRKQLANNLSNGLKLNKQEANDLLLSNNIQPSQRAETLTIKDWIQLTKML